MDNEQYLEEVQKALEKDTSRLGAVYRLVKKGKSLTEIAEELNVSNILAYLNRYAYLAIEKGKLSKSPIMARNSVKILRGFLKRHREDFSKATIQELVRRVIECIHIAEEEGAAKYGPGIYVYTYRQYHRYPVLEKSNRTYLKIGMSEKDTVKRVKQQQTGMPEKPMILQIWMDENAGDLREIEKKIHDHLRKAGHRGSQSKRREWFLTNEQFVASTANLIGLICIYDHTCHFDNRKPNKAKD